MRVDYETKKAIVFCLVIAGISMEFSLQGCGPPAQTYNPCMGDSGSVYSCSVGSCSKVGGSGCSKIVDGVQCCSGSSTPNDGTNACQLGYCLTSPENLCCPSSAPYACHGECYYSNVCNYLTYRTACHQW